MNNQEYYFYKIGENGKIDGLIIVVPNVSNNSVGNITTLVVSKEKNREERMELKASVWFRSLLFFSKMGR